MNEKNKLLTSVAATVVLLSTGCQPSFNWYLDSDSDGYGNPAISVTTDGAAPAGSYTRDNSDCNDSDNTINPGAIEIFDSIDNNCDGEVDNVAFWYADTDTDSYGDPTVSIQEPLQPEGYVADSSDCDDGNSEINPGATEVVDGLDNDCNGAVDDVPTWYADTDTDGYGDPAISTLNHLQPEGYVLDDTDCDDGDPNINPGFGEVFGDSIDNNCDGLVDEYVIGSTGPAGGIIFYVDATGFGGLEAAPEDASGLLIEWGCDDIDVAGTAEAIGTGAQNTATIDAAACLPSDPNDTDVANDLAVAYELNGFNDWFLPSRYELGSLWLAGDVVGNFKPAILSPFTGVCYWSSTQHVIGTAWSITWHDHVNFPFGGIIYGGSHRSKSKSYVCYVRAIRAL